MLTLKQDIQQKQNNELQQLFSPENNQPNTQVKYPSQFSTKYLELLNPPYPQSQAQSLQDLYKLLKEYHIQVVSKFEKNLQFQIIQTDGESYILLLHYGNYKLKINLLIIDICQNYFTSSQIGSGNYGTIYSIRVAQQSYAVKRIKLKQKNFGSGLLEVYTQYFMCTLASILKVGPKVFTPFGYDIIVTHNEAFFAMELCQNYTRQKYKEIKKQTLENLRIMHSLKFIHLDIKPANLAYSPIHQRCVFLDFGFSRLIQQQIGEKTISNFRGTLSFCSDEMRKIYFLSKKSPIDLYYNDLFAVKKVLNKIKDLNYLQENEDSDVDVDGHFGQDQHKDKVNEKDAFEILESPQPQIIYFEFEKNENVIEQSVYVFQLKFHIFLKNYEEVERFLPKLKNMPKSFYAILDNKTTQNLIKKYEFIQTNINKLQSLILKIKIQGSITDNIIGSALVKKNENLLVFGFQLSDIILNLGKQQFKQLLEDQSFLCNVLFFLGEFSKQNNFNQQKERFILSLIKKVNLINGRKKIDNFDQIHQHISSFLRFLNSSLKQMRTYKILNTLRLLFISIQDLVPVEQIQDEIISLITDPILKCLKITEFILFWQSALENPYQRLSTLEQVIFNMQSLQQNILLDKIKQLVRWILKNKNYRYYQNLESIMKVKKLIEECLLLSEQKQYINQFLVLQVMHLRLTNFNEQIKQYNETLKIYRPYFPLSKHQQLKKDKSCSFQIIFVSYVQAVKQLKFWQATKMQMEKKLEYWIIYILQLFRGRPDLINSYFLSKIILIMKSKKVIFFFVENLRLHLQVFFNEKVDFKSQKKNLSIRVAQVISVLMIENQLSQSELNSLYKQQQYLFALLSQQKNLQIQFLLKLLHLKSRILINNYEFFQQEILQIYKISAQNSHNTGQFAKIFAQILQILSKYPGPKQQIVQKMIIQFCSRHIILSDPYILRSFCNIFLTYIKINTKQQNYYNNRMFVQIALFHADISRPKFKIITLQSRYTTLLVQAFCFSTKPTVLKEIYEQISFKKQQFERMCYPFYIFFMFQALYPKHYSQKQVILKQLKRTCLCLCRMLNAHSLIARGIILIFCRSPVIVESKRKRRICSRMSVSYTQVNEGMIEKHVNLLHSQGKKINNLMAKQKFLKKILKPEI